MQKSEPQIALNNKKLKRYNRKNAKTCLLLRFGRLVESFAFVNSVIQWSHELSIPHILPHIAQHCILQMVQKVHVFRVSRGVNVRLRISDVVLGLNYGGEGLAGHELLRGGQSVAIVAQHFDPQHQEVLRAQCGHHSKQGERKNTKNRCVRIQQIEAMRDTIKHDWIRISKTESRAKERTLFRPHPRPAAADNTDR